MIDIVQNAAFIIKVHPGVPNHYFYNGNKNIATNENNQITKAPIATIFGLATYAIYNQGIGPKENEYVPLIERTAKIIKALILFSPNKKLTPMIRRETVITIPPPCIIVTLPSLLTTKTPVNTQIKPKE